MESFLWETRKVGKGKRVNLHLALALPTSDQDMVDAPSVVIAG